MSDIEELLDCIATLKIGEPLIDPVSQELETHSKTKMAEFRPEYLNCIPQFDGSPNDLGRYLSVCQSVIDTFYKAQQPESFQNVYLLNCIIGKLTGNAKLVLGTQNVSTWGELKAILNRHFADQRDEACLNRDLVMLRQQGNENPEQFYDRILHILNLLCSYTDAHEATEQARTLKKNLYNELALKTFLSGLKEPLGTNIRCMRPQDLPQALQFVNEESNIHYLRSSNNTPRPNNRLFNQFPRNRPQPNIRNNQFLRPSYNSFNPQGGFPRSNYNPFHQARYFSPPNFQNNSTFNNRPPTNVFRPNQNRPLPKPTPMSMSTRQTGRTFRSNNNNFGNTNNYQNPNHSNRNQNQSPNFTFEELYNVNMFHEEGNIADSRNSCEITSQNTRMKREPCEPEYVTNRVNADTARKCLPSDDANFMGIGLQDDVT